MHELSLAEHLIHLVVEEAERHRLHRIERMLLKVGRLRGVVPEILKQCMEFVGSGTIAEGAVVDFEIVQGRARCRSCSETFEIEEYLFLCPNCGQISGEILSGEEFELMEIEGEEGGETKG